MTSSALFVLGFIALTTAAAAGALSLRLRSPLETLLAAYIVGWAWLVISTTFLSAFDAMRTSTFWSVLIVGVVLGLLLWQRTGRPATLIPSGVIREVFADARLCLLTLSVAIAALYALALGVFVPANDGDVLAYHLPRVLFWRQAESIDWIADASDLRLNVMPPVAEIGQLSTVLVSGDARFITTPQWLALFASLVGVVAIARRLQFDRPSAMFGGLLFASLPAVILQATSGLNDLVLCSFLLSASVLLTSEDRRATVLGGLAAALCLSTKVTAVFGLPFVALLIATIAPRRSIRPFVYLAFGSAIGSAWYAVNWAKTGSLDGGLAEEYDQLPSHSWEELATTTRLLSFDVLDRSGIDGADALIFPLVGAAFVVVAGVRASRRASWRGLVFGGLVVAATPFALDQLGERGLAAWQRLWLTVGQDDVAFGRPVNFMASTVASAAESWYGPVLPLSLAATLALLVVRGRDGPRRTAAVLCAMAPVVSILGVAASVVYDDYRGRLIMYAVALAAAAASTCLSSSSLAWGLTGVAIVSMGMSLAMSNAKPSGVMLLEHRTLATSRESIWGRTRLSQLTQLRPGDPETAALAFVARSVPDDARIAVAPRPNDFLAPLFGDGLRRTVTLVGRRVIAAESAWLVLSPGAQLVRCRAAWQRVFGGNKGWRVLRRSATRSCSSDRHGATRNQASVPRLTISSPPWPRPLTFSTRYSRR